MPGEGNQESGEISRPPPDLLVGDTAFHVASTPTNEVLERCRRCSDQGYRVCLLVRHDHVGEAEAAVRDLKLCRVGVDSIESFVSQMLETMATYSLQERNPAFCELLRAYNRRLKVTAGGWPLMFEIPSD
jgi:hypothetical protein